MKNEIARAVEWPVPGCFPWARVGLSKAWLQQRIEASLVFGEEQILALNQTKCLLYAVRTVGVSRELGMTLSTALDVSTDMWRWYDRLVVQDAINLLRKDPQAVLGCGVSGASAVDDVWWEPVFQLLEREPGVAQRLVLELAEGARLDPNAGRAFFLRMKRCGCRLAIKQFGVRYGVQSAIAVDKPDFIKLDRTLMSAACESKRARQQLIAMLRLASEQAPSVVVETVERGPDTALAIEVGARWAQVRCAMNGA
jgi:EAL domain-containing protein (putative c-di-GMP-specific phosphodiesterase class I)